MKLHTTNYREEDGRLVEYETDELFVWAAVCKDGRVDMLSVQTDSDELGELVDGWEWKKLRLSLDDETAILNFPV